MQQRQFDIGVATGSRVTRGFPIVFSVLVNTDGGEEEAFRTEVRRADRNRWLRQRADLTTWAGKRVQITLAVTGPSGADSTDSDAELYPLWANPVLMDAERTPTRPHVILISIDCLRADHVGVYGYERNITPTIDAFATEADVFENAVAVSAWTLPTHMSMFTGLTPSYHGVNRTRGLSPSTFYLPQVLAEAGYETTAVVSGAYVSQAFGFARGFHRYLSLHQPEAKQTVDDALDVLARSSGRSTFLFLHFIDPHWPYRPPMDLLEKLGPAPENPENIDALLDKVQDRVPPTGSDVEDVIRLYDAEIADVDRELGRFFTGLEELGMLSSSLVIITADHGEAFYEHGYWGHTQTLYEEMIRIPLTVKWPDGRSSGRASRYASQVDIVPTVLEAVDLAEALPSSAQGTSLSDRMDDDKTASAQKIVSETIFASSDTTSKRVSFRSARWKYIATYVGPPPDAIHVDTMESRELYDLDSDPGERDNVTTSPLLDDFEQRLHAYLEEAGDFLETRESQREVILDEELIERLRALGYIH